MFFPNLIDEKLCNTPIKVIIFSEEIDKYGEPKEYTLNLKCNYQSSAKTILTNEQKIVQITGKAYFKGDIIPEILEISGGIVEIFKVERQIYKGYKCRNLDGTVNYTLLELL